MYIKFYFQKFIITPTNFMKLKKNAAQRDNVLKDFT